MEEKANGGDKPAPAAAASDAAASPLADPMATAEAAADDAAVDRTAAEGHGADGAAADQTAAGGQGAGLVAPVEGVAVEGQVAQADEGVATQAEGVAHEDHTADEVGAEGVASVEKTRVAEASESDSGAAGEGRTPVVAKAAVKESGVQSQLGNDEGALQRSKSQDDLVVKKWPSQDGDAARSSVGIKRSPSQATQITPENRKQVPLSLPPFLPPFFSFPTEREGEHKEREGGREGRRERGKEAGREGGRQGGRGRFGRKGRAQNRVVPGCDEDLVCRPVCDRAQGRRVSCYTWTGVER